MSTLKSFHFIYTACSIRLLQARQGKKDFRRTIGCMLAPIRLHHCDVGGRDRAWELSQASWCWNRSKSNASSGSGVNLAIPYAQGFCATSSLTADRRRQFSSDSRKCHDKNAPEEKSKATFFLDVNCGCDVSALYALSPSQNAWKDFFQSSGTGIFCE